ncbi:sensor histidine kinase [Chondrinema litorale]|uniref:sensor histidine kinase n=1 Tax=Chondrinema litorale TaxID=2994555 RepID=UPI002542934F|nr:ATP-binding protein [Chondrinema litorale]UZR99938.1 ATP-binding protein [Chondrinema litorale]
MIKPELPENESERLKALEAYQILDTEPELEFEDITSIASQICGTPISLITLLDSNRQWFKSKRGIDISETPRDIAFCAYSVLEPNKLLIVNDATNDERFKENPLVKGDPHVIFYAGAPLVTPTGYPLGTLCVIDNKPNSINEEQKKALTSLARQVVIQLELKRVIKQQIDAQQMLKKANEELNKFAYIASHDIKNPLQSMIALSDIIFDDHAHQLDDEGKRLFSLLQQSANNLSLLVDEILEYSKLPDIINLNKEHINTEVLVKQLFNLLKKTEDVQLNIKSPLPVIHSNRMALTQVFQNLMSNAIKYNNSKNPEIKIKCTVNKDFYIFAVKDNGTGIPKKHQANIFEMFQTLGKKDRFGKKGTGIGLATVKKLVESMGGEIKLESKQNKGSTFIFSIKK